MTSEAARLQINQLQDELYNFKLRHLTYEDKEGLKSVEQQVYKAMRAVNKDIKYKPDGTAEDYLKAYEHARDNKYSIQLLRKKG